MPNSNRTQITIVIIGGHFTNFKINGKTPGLSTKQVYRKIISIEHACWHK